MTFLSTRDQRETLQTLQPATSFMQEEPSFSEVFQASLGLAIDEEMSFSSLLNREGFDQRKKQVSELVGSGQLNIEQYTTAFGQVDYNAIAENEKNLKLKSDKEIFLERNEMLAQRRHYAQDVMERGSGLAQFLGMANAFILDPVNILTIPIATSTTALKSLTTIGKALTVAKNEAALAATTELAIQPLVYQHKHSIGSPFEVSDAISNIVIASTGAGLIGGVTGGISGYFSKIREKASNFPLDDDSVLAVDALQRIEEDLLINKGNIDLESTFKEIEETFLNKKILELEQDVSKKLTRGQRKELTKELDELTNNLNKIESPDIQPEKGKDIPARKAKAEAKAKAEIEVQSKKGKIQTRINEIIDTLEVDQVGRSAESNLSRIKQGITPEDFKKEIDELKKKKEVEIDAEFLKVSNEKMKQYESEFKTPEQYEDKSSTKPSFSKGTVSEREREVLKNLGIEEAYDSDMAKFKLLESPKIVQNDEVIDAGDFMESLDSEISGIDDVLRCAIG